MPTLYLYARVWFYIISQIQLHDIIMTKYKHSLMFTNRMWYVHQINSIPVISWLPGRTSATWIVWHHYYIITETESQLHAPHLRVPVRSTFGWFTLISAQHENSMFTSLLARQMYMPASSGLTLSMHSRHVVWVGRGSRPLNQRYDGLGTPVASHSRMTVCPRLAGTASGCTMKLTASENGQGRRNHKRYKMWVRWKAEESAYVQIKYCFILWWLLNLA